MKKILLTLLGVLIALPAFARDFTYEYEGQTLTYTVISESAKTCQPKPGEHYWNISSPGNSVSGELTIPSVAKYGNTEYSVIRISADAFRDCTRLTSVIIPNSVTSIGSEAFNGCSGLKKSAYPNTLSNPFTTGTCIAYNPDEAVFENGWIYGTDKTSITFAPLSLEGEYIIPETVTSIESGAFSGCTGLTSVIIPNSVTSIGSDAFKNCTGLTSVIIPNSVTSIESGTFSGCTGLTSVIIPNSVTSIGSDAFKNCI